jgi:hypothetical protein
MEITEHEEGIAVVLIDLLQGTEPFQQAIFSKPSPASQLRQGRLIASQAWRTSVTARSSSGVTSTIKVNRARR